MLLNSQFIFRQSTRARIQRLETKGKALKERKKRRNQAQVYKIHD